MTNYYFYQWERSLTDKAGPGDRITVSVRETGSELNREEFQKLRSRGIEVFCFLPSFWETEDEDNLQELEEALPYLDGIYINNTGQLKPARAAGLELAGDYGLNVFNTETAEFFRGLGVNSVLLSPELKDEVHELAAELASGCEVLVKGRIPAMVSRYCPLAGALGIKGDHCGKCSDYGVVYLKDSMGESYPVITDDVNCTATILSKKELRNRKCGDIQRICIL